MRHVCLTLFVLSLLPATAVNAAEPIFPDTKYPALHEQMERHSRQFYNINAHPFGLSLDAHAKDQASREVIEQFLEQSSTYDIKAATGKHPYELLVSYGEYGDLGFFGGVAVAGTAYEYMTLRRDGATPELLERARQRVVRAADSWHIFYVASGGNGVVARGIRRMVSEHEDEPPLPVTYPEMVPLFDEAGGPLPQPKNNGAYRWDNSGGLLPKDEWIWKDSASKDQVSGQVFAMVALYDAMKNDPDIDQALVERLSEDALSLANVLMTKREISKLEGPVGIGEYDLIIMDADGRPTYHHDLNPYSLEKLYLDPADGSFNVFNLFMALGVMKGLYHVTGDPAIEEYIYNELLYERDFIGMVENAQDATEGALDYIYAGTMTNFDNPDMTSIALWLNIYLEKDPEVLAPLRHFLEHGWWIRKGESHTAANCKQPLWHAIYMGLTDTGVSTELIDDNVDLLLGFDLGPYWNDARINCDEAEIAANECLAVDGETILTLSKVEGVQAMATEALHPSIRPPSNFDARSNPFEVNGGGGMRLNPGGDLLCAYWFGRYFPANEAGETNVSPLARKHMPMGGWHEEKPDLSPEPGPDVSEGADHASQPDTARDLAGDSTAPVDEVPAAGGKKGGGCSTGSGPSAGMSLLLLLLLALCALRCGRAHLDFFVMMMIIDTSGGGAVVRLGNYWRNGTHDSI